LNTYLFYLVIILAVLFSSCNKKSYSALYHKNHLLAHDEIKYYLPKNLLKLEIIYTLNEPRVYRNGIDEALTASTTKVTIEDSIQITNVLVADTSLTFFAGGKQLLNKLFTNEGVSPKNCVEKKTLHISSAEIIKASPFLLPSFTATNIEAEAYKAALEMKDKIIKVTNKEDIELGLNLVLFYKSQFKILNEDFKPYLKKSKVKYTVYIDPMQLYSKKGRYSKIKKDEIHHTIFPKHIFKNNMVLKDVVTLVFQKPKVLVPLELTNNKPVDGILYRDHLPKKLRVLLNNYSTTTEPLILNQLDIIKTISINDLQRRTNSSVVLFKLKDVVSDSCSISKFQETKSFLGFDTSKTVEASQEEIKRQYEEKLKNIDLLIAKLQERKKEL